jgi:hypothetical protein
MELIILLLDECFCNEDRKLVTEDRWKVTLFPGNCIGNFMTKSFESSYLKSSSEKAAFKFINILKSPKLNSIQKLSYYLLMNLQRNIVDSNWTIDFWNEFSHLLNHHQLY